MAIPPPEPFRRRTRRFAFALLLTGLACRRDAGEHPVPAREDPPARNVILIVVDAMRADHLGALGYERDTTPNLDALARRGFLFTRAYSAASWTLPAVASFMTSVYPSVHGLRRPPTDPAHDSLPAEFVTLAESLSGHGLATASITSQPWISERTGLTQGFDEVQTLAHASLPGEARILAGGLIDWLRKPRESGFFLYAHFMGPHSPYDVPSSFTGRYTGGRPVPPTIAEFHRLYEIENEAVAYRRIADIAIEDGLGPEDIAYLRDEYDEKLAFTDACLGILFEELERMGLFRNSVVVVTADHGEAFYEHGTIFHGEHVHEELVRVPLIVRVPGESWRPARIDQVVELIDLYPTVHELLRLPIPGHLDGRSLVPVMQGGPSDGVAFSEAGGFKVVTGDWSSFYPYGGSLHVTSGFTADELYHLAVDPLERNDLAGFALEPAAHQRELAFGVWQEILALQERYGFEAAQARLDPETEDRLRRLGYLGAAP